ncbi:Bax inhibitor-1/YccA family protein [Gluconobacter sp. Dm-62]|uniref:Bax inhibitor-1/YccA family protein n=1 Tax=Gluconobacter sp. Dm-62 TaxID=2799804 RepID=UPI001B8D9214|nr:Bax inhibitor-1/YccA family protein [Gluconobacter sp. Dm-62]MBS1103117.1 Bax inhibitor-1/YccA family protein [Gluconobacter sp. Dm-62]
MAFNTNFSRAGVQAGAGSLDAGLRAYMCRVFNWMALGLVITGLVAYGVAQTSLRALFFHLAEMPNGAIVLRPTLLGGISIFAPLVFVMVLSFGVNRLSRPAVQGIFLLFSAAMGASMASILLSYTGVSVARTFFVTAITFAGMSLWGYVTGANLARLGSFLFMGLIGIVLASVVNIFLHSSPLAMLVSVIGVGLFTLLAAYDTQRIKITYQQYMAYAGSDEVAKMSVYDALTMYLNFVNLFQFLIQFMGVRSGNND